ncbi:MAG: serine protease [Arachidicoccus sp.]|nr:serine protease [Arachidicoccus sp.]
MADSILVTSMKVFTPSDAAAYLRDSKNVISPSLKIKVAKRRMKSLFPTLIYANSKPAVGLVAMCSKPNLSKEISVNPASAFVITPDGVCLTNYHVVYAYAHSKTLNDQGIFLIRLGNGRTYVMEKVLALSPQDDLALIKIDVKGERLPYVKLRNMDAEVGEKAYVLGNSFGQLYSLTQGIVSGKYNETMVLPGRTGRAARNLMSITADFSVGASGSPILDNNGYVIGIVSSTNIVEQQSNGRPMTQMVIKNAIPVSSIKHLIQSIVSSN